MPLNQWAVSCGENSWPKVLLVVNSQVLAGERHIFWALMRLRLGLLYISFSLILKVLFGKGNILLEEFRDLASIIVVGYHSFLNALWYDVSSLKSFLRCCCKDLFPAIFYIFPLLILAYQMTLRIVSERLMLYFFYSVSIAKTRAK